LLSSASILASFDAHALIIENPITNIKFFILIIKRSNIFKIINARILTEYLIKKGVMFN